MSQKNNSSLFIALFAILLMALMFRGLKLFISQQITADDFKIYVTEKYNSDIIIDEISVHDKNAKLIGLKLLLKIRKYDDNVKTGCYTIRKGFSARNISDVLTSGSQTPVKVVINSTRTVDQMAKMISQQLMLDSTQISNQLKDSVFLDSIGYSAATVFSLIIPNTYEFYWNVSSESFMQRMVKEHDIFWNESRKQKAAEIGLTQPEVMTLASIVEEETVKSDERPIVAGLYMNRLKKNMPLQADPTVIFALGGERPKRVLNVHLKIDSPYNTYKHTGLPPAPIRFVSTSSIDAVLNYARHKYLYMCAKEDFSGYHNFSATLAGHNINAIKYQRALSAASRQKK